MNWFRKLLYGRYGSDTLGRVMLFASLGAIVLEMLTEWWIFYFATLLLLIVSYFRIFSKNISARQRENEMFLRWWYPLKKKLYSKGGEIKDQKTHVHCKCSACGQKIRVPRGRGKISITCPNCGHAFLKKT